MAISITPTLSTMADIYRLSASGGAKSDRFIAYRKAAEHRLPIYGYNPMTREPILQAIEALIDLGSEEIAHEAANIAAAEIGFDQDTTMHVVVATPGMWTDRLATEIDHRLKANDPAGVLLWIDGPSTIDHVLQQTIAQTVRLAAYVKRCNLAPTTLNEAVIQEGRALALSGVKGELHDEASDIMGLLGNETGVPTMVAFLYGDEAASKLGYTPLGLGDRVGYRHAASLHA